MMADKFLNQLKFGAQVRREVRAKRLAQARVRSAGNSKALWGRIAKASKGRTGRVARIERFRARQGKGAYKRLVSRTRRGRVEAAKARAAQKVKGTIGRIKALDRKNGTRARISRINASADRKIAAFDKKRERKMIKRLASALGGARRAGKGGSGASGGRSDSR